MKPFLLFLTVSFLLPLFGLFAQEASLEYWVVEEYKFDEASNEYVYIQQIEGVCKIIEQGDSIIIPACQGTSERIFSIGDNVRNKFGGRTQQCYSNGIDYLATIDQLGTELSFTSAKDSIVYHLIVIENELEVMEREFSDDISIEYSDDYIVVPEGYAYDMVEEEVPAEPEVFEFVEETPSFTYKGIEDTENALKAYFADSLRWPSQADVQGTVYIKFVVEIDGSLSNFKVMRGIHAAFDEEALRLIKAMPSWKPGKQRGRKVRSYMMLPVKFILLAE